MIKFIERLEKLTTAQFVLVIIAISFILHYKEVVSGLRDGWADGRAGIYRSK